MRYAHLLFPTLAVCGLAALSSCAADDSAGAAENQQPTEAQQAAAPVSPATGFDVHVMAPHVVNGKVMGPFHHYCKAISPEPVIQCILFETIAPDAPMTEVEYIVAKSITRDMISREQWNRAWHDHATEIASGRVQILDMPEADAAALAEVVKTTDGLIFHMWPAGSRIPTGDVSIAQAVSHVALNPAQWKQQQQATMAAAPATGGE